MWYIFGDLDFEILLSLKKHTSVWSEAAYSRTDSILPEPFWGHNLEERWALKTDEFGWTSA